MQPISPELALVDPELAAHARAALPDPPDCLSRLPGEESVQSPLEPGAARTGPGRRARVGHSSMRRASVVASCAVFAAFVGTSLLAFIPPGESASPVVLDSTAANGTGTTVSRGPSGSSYRLRWSADPRADAYDVILVSGEHRQDRWVQDTSIRLRLQPSEQGQVSRWYVYPAYRDTADYTYGSVLAQGSLAGRTTFAGGGVPVLR